MNIQSIPDHIIEAERTLSQWFAENNIENWELGKSQSRDFVDLRTYAGVTMWIGNFKVKQILTEHQVRRERYSGQVMTETAQQCLDDLARIINLHTLDADKEKS